MVAELSFDKLRITIDPNALGCATSEEVEPLDTIIGQERAVHALHFGLDIKALGFNIFVAGLPGTGRTTAAERFLESIAKDKPVPSDWCYVNNFRDPYRPRALRLPPGRGKQFQAEMKSLIEGVRREIRRVLESEDYAAKREEVAQAFQKQQEELFERISEKARQEGFFIQMTPIGLATIPLKDGKPLSDEQFIALEAKERDAINHKREELQAEMKTAFRQGKSLEKSANEELKNLEQKVALFALSPLIDDLKEKYQDQPQVMAYLDEVRDDILQNLALFRAEPQEQPATPFLGPEAKELPFRKYEVSVLVDNSQLKGAPVIMERNPTYSDLFGRIEKEAQFGALITDFTLIRAGSLHRANGGYLLLPVEELLRNFLSWDSLKRALRNREIVIEEAGERLGFITTKSLRPEPIPLDVKVVLIGQTLTYHLLYAYDEDFRELFKVKADFDSRMERSEKTMGDYIAFVCAVCKEEELKHLESSALAQVIQHGCRLAEDQHKLSTRFGELTDIIREANYYATQEGSRYVSGQHVQKAIEQKFYRSNLLQESIREMIERGQLLVDVSGAKTGQLNGLSVVDLGDITFGQPNRITASISLGQEGIIDIEREAKLGGPIHSKGVMILSGYLAEQYAQQRPLTLTARLVFEQSYSGVEGDSASSAELYALLSSLSGLPIKQGIAVTGSVNQKGEVQAIGGVNEKVEGFFEVCRAKGLSGEQGVIIPASNVQNLMLKDTVVQAVKEGQFHLWSVQTVDEGIEILTGVKAGMRKEDGTFEENTVHYRVDKRLHEMAEAMKEFGKEEKEKGTE